MIWIELHAVLTWEVDCVSVEFKLSYQLWLCFKFQYWNFYNMMVFRCINVSQLLLQFWEKICLSSVYLCTCVTVGPVWYPAWSLAVQSCHALIVVSNMLHSGSIPRFSYSYCKTFVVWYALFLKNLNFVYLFDSFGEVLLSLITFSILLFICEKMPVLGLFFFVFPLLMRPSLCNCAWLA